jgi:hypothetical protein
MDEENKSEEVIEQKTPKRVRVRKEDIMEPKVIVKEDKVSYGVLAIFLVIGLVLGAAGMSIYDSYNKPATTITKVDSGVGGPVVTANIMNFLYARGVVNASVLSVRDNGEFYEVVMNLPEGEVPALVTKDGKTLLPILVNLSELPNQQPALDIKATG